MKCNLDRQATGGDSAQMVMSLMDTIVEEQTTVKQEAVEKPCIDIRNLNFYYGDFQGLKNVNLPIYDKKVTAFIGPSGCGKSTGCTTCIRNSVQKAGSCSATRTFSTAMWM